MNWGTSTMTSTWNVVTFQVLVMVECPQFKYEYYLGPQFKYEYYLGPQFKGLNF